MSITLALRPVFDAWNVRHDVDDGVLAKYLRVSPATLVKLYDESVPGEVTAGIRGIGDTEYSGPATPQPGTLERLHDGYGVDTGRLYDVFLGMMGSEFDEDE